MKVPENPSDNAEQSAAAQFLLELEDILNEQTSSTEEKVEDVYSLVEDWRNELFDKPQDRIEPRINTTKEASNEQRLVPHDAALFSTAQAEYLDKHNITLDEYHDMDFADMVTHREGITKLYREMLTEQTREKAVAKLGNGPFLKVEEEDEADEEVSSDARSEWYKEQVSGLNNDIAVIDMELTNIEKQEQNTQLNSMLRQVNLARIKELEFEKKGLVARLGHYKSKLST